MHNLYLKELLYCIFYRHWFRLFVMLENRREVVVHLVIPVMNFQVHVYVMEGFASIYRISGMLPKVLFTVSIDRAFKIVFYNHSKLTSIRNLLRFAACKVGNMLPIKSHNRVYLKTTTKFKC